jgi:parallel beta-helix repeat protein
MKRKCLAIGIILLFIGTGIIPAIAQESEKPSQSTSRGNWLYVGGSGPGNYTTIQSAINATNPGDTVFVYDDSSPYFENVVVDKSINLIGEDRDTTIIDGNRRKEVVHINTNSVEVKGFTITKGDHRGIYCEGGASNITIASCVCFDNNESGEWGEQISLYGYQNCRIFDNIISSADREIVLDYENATNGIYIEGGTHNSVFNNSIYENFYGVKVGWSSNKNIVLNNVIELNLIGIGVFGGDTSAQNRISKNYVYRNFFGVIVHSTGNTIDNNTIVENGFLNIYNGTFGLGVDHVNWSRNLPNGATGSVKVDYSVDTWVETLPIPRPIIMQWYLKRCNGAIVGTGTAVWTRAIHGNQILRMGKVTSSGNETVYMCNAKIRVLCLDLLIYAELNLSNQIYINIVGNQNDTIVESEGWNWNGYCSDRSINTEFENGVVKGSITDLLKTDDNLVYTYKGDRGDTTVELICK